jgi:DtxR family Mn-dependent transcriptional regulator
MSEAVERKLVNLLDHPTTSPYGNPIPGLDKLGVGEPAPPVEPDLMRVDEVARRGGGTVLVRRIAEHIQLDTDVLTELKSVGIVPGGTVEVSPMGERGNGIEVKGAGNAARIGQAIAHAVLVHAMVHAQ